jgi:DNA helicase II / ATP-dependent DNA helicase PcrA
MTTKPLATALNSQQIAIVEHVLSERVTVVSAGAGSGKTRTLVAAVVELIARGHAQVDEFALVTFTVKAAEELHARLRDELSSRVTEGSHPWGEQMERLSAAFVGTIHGYCHDLVRGHGGATHVPRSSSVTLSSFPLHQALVEVLDRTLDASSPEAIPELGDLGMADYQIRQLVQRVLSHCRSIGITPTAVLRGTEEQPADRGKPYRLALARLLVDVSDEYSELKAARGSLDADDLLEATAALLDSEHGPAVAERACARHPIVIVDEFQDTDRTQKRIVDALLPSLRRLLVVGDLKQSIYGFRSADPSLLKDLAREQGVTPLSLNVSYRPTTVLLEAQNALFARLGHHYPEIDEPLEAEDDTLQTGNPMKPVIYDLTGKDEAASAVAGYIHTLLERELPGADRQIKSGDIVILARSNRLADRLTESVGSLLAPDVAVRRDTGESFYEAREIVSTYLLLQAVLRPGDDVALVAALGGLYMQDVDPAQQELNLLQYRPTEGAPLTDWLAGEHIEHAERLAELRSAVRTDTAPQFLGRLYNSYGIIARLRARGGHLQAERLEHLREEARRLFRSEEALTVRIFADYLRLRILQRYDVDLQTGEADLSAPNHVRVMTIHKAKGLQFPVVILPGLWAPLMSEYHQPEFIVSAAEGLDLKLSDLTARTASPRWGDRLEKHREERLREEFRLLYVAITRAQHSVILIGGEMRTQNQPSSSFYCWRDEVLPALQDMRAEGTAVSIVGAGRAAARLEKPEGE